MYEVVTTIGHAYTATHYYTALPMGGGAHWVSYPVRLSRASDFLE